MTHVLFTGGGTAGHVTPNVALIEAAQKRGWQIDYVGSASGIEKQMIENINVPFHAIASGKLRRYFSWENFVDPFRILLGIVQAFILCRRLRPDIVFSKGGFVSVPVVVAAWLQRIPVISHESDVTPGLANKLAYPFCSRICVTFEVSRKHLPAGKTLVTGTPVRRSILEGKADAGKAFLGIAGDNPVLLVFGGSLGAKTINDQIRAVLLKLVSAFNVVHVTGRGNADSALDRPGYIQKEFVSEEFGDVLAAADFVVARAGANSLYELFLLRKPHLLIPLGLGASRGDQIVNAATFEREGYSRALREEDLTDASFLAALEALVNDADDLRAKMGGFAVHDSVELILREIEQIAR